MSATILTKNSEKNSFCSNNEDSNNITTLIIAIITIILVFLLVSLVLILQALYSWRIGKVIKRLEDTHNGRNEISYSYFYNSNLIFLILNKFIKLGGNRSLFSKTI